MSCSCNFRISWSPTSFPVRGDGVASNVLSYRWWKLTTSVTAVASNYSRPENRWIVAAQTRPPSVMWPNNSLHSVFLLHRKNKLSHFLYYALHCYNNGLKLLGYEIEKKMILDMRVLDFLTLITFGSR